MLCQKSLKFACRKFLIWCILSKNISLPGKTPNHLKLRIPGNRNVEIIPDVKVSSGLFISAEC